MASANQSARLVPSSRGGQILEFAGYRYTRRSVNRSQTMIYWRCIERYTCNATCTSNYNTDSGIIVRQGKEHTHEIQTVEIEVQEVVRRIKRRAEEQPNEPPSAVYISQVSNVTNEEVLSNMPQRNDLLRNINRIQNRHRPMNPHSIEHLVIQHPYNVTLTGEPFYQYDSESEDRFILFYTVKDLERLCQSSVIVCDGTFKTAPNMFFQLYTIHGSIHGYTFPLIYCISTRKTEAFYRDVLDRLKTHAAELNFELNPEIILSDYEIAFMNAARAIFPNSSIKGCLFHLTQSIYKQVVIKGLKSQYHNVSVIRDFVQKLLALPFVPEGDIQNVFDDIVETMPETSSDDEEKLLDLINYVERTYVRGRRGTARFPPNIWCVYPLVLNKYQRTTNEAEGWHSRFQSLINTHHAGIWKFLEFLQKDQRQNEIMMIQIAAGHTRVRYPIKGKYKSNQLQVEQIVNRYQAFKDNGNIMQYLKSISYKLKLRAEPDQEEDADEE